MRPAPSPRLTLIACALASAIVFIDSTVVNVALPALRADLDAGLATQQWVVESYLLTLASLMLVGGSLGDLYGRRRVLLYGLLGFGAASLACALAPNAGVLVAARALQGVAGALLVPSSLAIITATFPPAERGAAIGSWTAWTGIGILAGPPLGGLLIDTLSWRTIFAVNVPLVAVAVLMIVRGVAESRDPDSARRPDLVGALLCVVGLGGPVLALIEQPTRGWAAVLVWLPMALGLAALVAFVVHERRARHPMLPLGLFAERAFAVSNVVTLAVYAGLGAGTLFIALFVQQALGYSGLEAGLMLMPVTLIMFFLSRRWGALAGRVGPRGVMTLGPLLGGLGLMGTSLADDPGDYLFPLLPAILLFGLGLSMTVAPLTATVLEAVADRHAGIASGVNNAVARVAGLLAIAVVGAIVSSTFGATLDARLAGTPLERRTRAAIAEVRARPLAPIDEREIAGADRARVVPAAQAASQDGFRAGMLAAGLLMASGGGIAFAGLPRRRHVVPQPSEAPA